MSLREIHDRGFERINGYSDAVVAIAVTLLVLPLTTIEAGRYDGDVRELFRANFNSFLSFLVSFVLISALWIFHHRFIRVVDRYDDLFVLFNSLWLLTIVFLPFPTYVMGSESTVTGSEMLLYYGTITASSLCLSVMRSYAHRRGFTMTGEGVARATRRARIQGWVSTAMLALIFLVLLTGSGILRGPESLLLGCVPLLLLLFSGPVAAMIIKVRPE